MRLSYEILSLDPTHLREHWFPFNCSSRKAKEKENSMGNLPMITNGNRLNQAVITVLHNSQQGRAFYFPFCSVARQQWEQLAENYSYKHWTESSMCFPAFFAPVEECLGLHERTMAEHTGQKYNKTKFCCCPLYRTISGLFGDEKKVNYLVGFYIVPDL